MPEFLELMADEDFKGFHGIRNPRQTDSWKFQLAEVNRLIENRAGDKQHIWNMKLMEAMSTDTFTFLFADILDRKLEAAFIGVGTPLAPVFRKATLRDFRDKRIISQTGLVRRLERVKERGEYVAREVGDASETYALEKWGNLFQWSWETFLNDDLGLIDSWPQGLAQSAINTEAFLQTSLLFDADGPIDAIMTGTGGLAAIATTALSIANLEAAIVAMQSYTDNGEPIINKPKFLIVGPLLELTARKILADAPLMITTTAGVQGATHNAIREFRLELIVDPWLPLVATNNTSTWALVADPQFAVGAEWAGLRGHEGPELFIKTPNQQSVGGGASDPMMGSFEDDTAAYKMRRVMNGTAAIEHRAFWGSKAT